MQTEKILSTNPKVIPLIDLLGGLNREALGFKAFHRIITFTGSRSITKQEQVYRVLDRMIEAYEKKTILKMDMLWVMGEARGIDTTIANYARMAEMPYTIIPALWEIHGKRAGILRNQVMVGFADVVVGFWDGVSPGTKHCLDYARKQNKRVHCFTMGLNR